MSAEAVSMGVRVREVSAEAVSVGEMSAEAVSVGEMGAEAVSVGEMSEREMSVGEMTVGEVTVRERSARGALGSRLGRARASRLGATLALGALAGTAGCGSEEPAPRLGDDAAFARPIVLTALEGVRSEPVVGWVGPGGAPFAVTLRTPGTPSAVHRTIGRVTFELSLRPGALSEYPCTTCHLGLTVTADRTEDAHQYIEPLHPSALADRCTTCHLPSNVALLALQTGENVSLDHAYRLCAQCHYSVADAWAGGAHGKRLDGWTGSRVVMGCADCHDPHRPALEQRIPFPGPTLP